MHPEGELRARGVGAGRNLDADLTLNYRVRRARGGYRVCVAMHDLPGSVFWAKDARHPQGSRSHLLLTTDLGFEPLYLDEIGQVRCGVPRQRLEAAGPAVSVIPSGTLDGLSDLLPPNRNGPEWIGEAGVFRMGVEPLCGFRIAPKELVQRSVVFVNEVV
jgi:hypothetical protein